MKKTILSAAAAVAGLTIFTGAAFAQVGGTGDVTIFGTSMPFKKAVISTRVAGIVEIVPDIEGVQVKSGEVIIKINKKDFDLSADVLRKQVKLSEISSSHASTESKRMTDLFGRNATSAQMRDNAVFAKDSAYASLELTRSNLRIAEKAIEDSSIIAPFDGLISKKYLNAGEYVDRGKPVVEIVNIDTIKVHFKVPEKFIGKVSVGNKIKMSLEHCSETAFIGEVYAVNPVGDSVNHSFEIVVTVNNAGHAIKAGMFVKGVLSLNAGTEKEAKAISQNTSETKKQSSN
ncbi:MAG: hypothetical protein A2008_00270 [Candidatus Wallbacteria bacterium GWC2_49_35]|uniref:Uncharacterized protein n=1 Tax=Candidatus Wallbacteria bacterium GWC2_49_35 TaxID=1817813 RepID=A0A1F7X1Q0_9BACT|nr:MAG: hypothetical protein A2008_00270 [Candidatus Wallbacteria bacterium GWC2_49_35]